MDLYPHDLIWLVAVILLLSVIDATLTLALLGLGAVELNVMMVGLIERDTGVFVATKMAVTGLSLILLAVHFRFHVFNVPVTWILLAALLGYATLIHYEIGMLLQAA